jgi:hypothetical protein
VNVVPFVVQATPATQQLGAPRLTAVLRNGRVAAFVFPVGAQGD